LFFLHLAHLTQSMHFDRIARNSFRTLKFRFEEASSHWSIGGFSGLGGFVYLCSHLYKLWQDDESKAFALRAVDLLQDQIDNDTRLDIIAGSAGAICGLLSLYKNTGIEQALVAAIACGNHLIANSDRMELIAVFPTGLPGFHGRFSI
ncbi:MAG: hypothetical protein NTV34_13005, partial [Proteobacteria bacterium]|nr:hypothetical protein [Pseudomonadota bacterium]